MVLSNAKDSEDNNGDYPAFAVNQNKRSIRTKSTSVWESTKKKEGVCSLMNEKSEYQKAFNKTSSGNALDRPLHKGIAGLREQRVYKISETVCLNKQIFFFSLPPFFFLFLFFLNLCQHLTPFSPYRFFFFFQ